MPRKGKRQKQRRRRGPPLAPKYILRRLMLLVIACALLAGLIFLAARLIGGEKAPEDEPDEPIAAEAAAAPRREPLPARDDNGEPQPDADNPDDEEEEAGAPAAAFPQNPTGEGEGPPAPQPAEPIRAELEEAEPLPWNLIVVNRQRPLPEDFAPRLETVVGDLKVDARVHEPLLRMMAAARSDGIILTLNAAYRTGEQQAALYDDFMEALLDPDELAARVAPAGASEYQTGLSVDLVTPDHTEPDESFADTPAYAWLRDNAGDYGFILRYPRAKQELTGVSFTPWHYRYVGVDEAREIGANGLSLEEYVENLLRPEAPPVDEDEEPPEEEGN